jgi:hypothetical protein
LFRPAATWARPATLPPAISKAAAVTVSAFVFI